MKNFTNQIESWHEFVQTKDETILDALFTEDIEFHSPFVWKPKRGKIITKAIIFAVIETFQNFHYVRQIVGGENAVLEFEAEIEGLTLRGVDLLTFNENGQIEHFEVMIRPANALLKVGKAMTKKLTEKGFI